MLTNMSSTNQAEPSTYVPMEVAYRKQRVSSSGQWKRKVCKTKRQYDAFIAKLQNDQNAEWDTEVRVADGFFNE